MLDVLYLRRVTVLSGPESPQVHSASLSASCLGLCHLNAALLCLHGRPGHGGPGGYAVGQSAREIQCHRKSEQGLPSQPNDDMALCYMEYRNLSSRYKLATCRNDRLGETCSWVDLRLCVPRFHGAPVWCRPAVDVSWGWWHVGGAGGRGGASSGVVDPVR